MTTCPCRLNDEVKIDLDQCCGPYLSGVKTAPTAEALMRSRYSAYATLNMNYLEKSHKKNHGDEFDPEAALKWAQGSDWKGLIVHKTVNGKGNDQTGLVEFTALFADKASGKLLEHKENSTFEKIGNEWVFVDGEIAGVHPLKRATPKIGRNDPCHCGSGKKYKKCCSL